MTWKDIEDNFDLIKVFIIPVGSTEQHGPHLPMQTDSISVEYVAIKAAEELHPKIVVTPTIRVGFSPHHMIWPGTLSLSANTLIDTVFDICSSLKRHGFEKVLLLNGHGGNVAPLTIAGRRAKEELGLQISNANYWAFIPKELANKTLKTGFYPGHADEFETSTNMYLTPKLVQKDKIKPTEEASDEEYVQHFIQTITERSMTGVPPGRHPEYASADKSKILLEAAVKNLITFLNKFIKHGEPPKRIE
jgi:creatinine amidohydrolase